MITSAELSEVLTNAHTGDTIEVKLPQGGIALLSVEMKIHKTDIVKKYAGLVGNPITLSEAAQKYDVPRTTVEKWLYRNNYLKTIGETYPMVIDESDMAACAEIYHERKKIGSRAPLFDDDGFVYELQRPNLAEYRRSKKE